MVAAEDAHDVEGEGGGVGAGEHGAPVDELRLHGGEFLQQLQAPVQQRLRTHARGKVSVLRFRIPFYIYPTLDTGMQSKQCCRPKIYYFWISIRILPGRSLRVQIRL